MEVNSTSLITSELGNQRARKVLFSCVVYTKTGYFLADRSQGFAVSESKHHFRLSKRTLHALGCEASYRSVVNCNDSVFLNVAHEKYRTARFWDLDCLHCAGSRRGVKNFEFREARNRRIRKAKRSGRDRLTASLLAS